MSSITVAVIFTKSSGQPATGLTLSDIAIYLKSRVKSTGVVATVWNGVAPTEEVGGGLYTKRYTSADESTYEYYAWAVYSGAETLDSNYALHLSPEFSGAAVWGHDTRTVTQAAASVMSAVQGSMITITRGDTLSASLTSLGSLSGYVSIDFMVKRRESDTDDQAVIWIRKNASGSSDGLLRLNGADASARSSNGSITIDDADDGDITIALAAAETDDLAAEGGLHYEVQLITASAVATKTSGASEVVGDIVRAVS